MDRTSPVHYIAPSTISITPNANGSPDDLAVYVARGCKVKVYSPKAGIDYENGVAQEWEMSGRNRRLGESNKPYTIYVRLPKRFKDRGYLVFAAKTYADGGWHDTYPYITPDGESAANISEYWYLRLGDVTLPENGQRTVTYDTGILGTEQFNTEWALNPDSLPLRIELGCTVNDEDAGPTPYVYWGQSLVLTAMLTEGWTGTDIERFDHWEITRDSGNAQADTTWNAVDRSATFGRTGSITLQHGRGAGNTDDFNSAVNSTFTVKAMERTDDPEEGGTPVYAVLKTASICIMAETWEKYELSLAAQMVTYNPITQTYSPNNGVKFNIRATDQKSNTFLLTNKQLTDAGLVAQYAVVGVTPEIWTPITISGPDSNVAEGTVPASAFSTNQKSINVRLLNAVQTELHRTTIAFLRDGEDSKEREWIFLRSTEAITFGTQEHPYPASIAYGEVNPTGAAGHVTNDKNQDGWVPEGWWDEQQGVDETNRFEYGAHRDFVKESGGVAAHWGAFTNPTIWNHYGTDGDDGLYYKDEYARSKSRTSHASADIDTSYGTNGWGAAAPAASGEYVYIWKRTRQWDPNNNDWATGSSWAYVCETGADGTGQPDYIQTQEAWSNAESVNNPTTEPTPNGGWSDTTPSNPNDYAYLWRRSRKMVLQSDGSYAAATGTDGQWKYTRLSGTNGTSIKTKGTIAVAITASGTWPTTGFSANDLGIKQGDATVWKFNGTAWSETSVESEDGDSYTVTKDCIIDLDGDGTSSNIKGHLVMWSAEAGKWVDLGEFKGDPGTTYYTHVAWGKDVVLSSSELPIPDGQTNRPNATSVPYFSIAPATGYNWMGILINTSSSDPTSSDKLKYTWQNTEGQQGTPGGNTATVYLYKRRSSAVSSVGISATLYYKFSTRKLYTNAACTTEASGSDLNEWSLTIPANSTDPIYATAAIAYSNTESDDITNSEWVTPAQFTENGEHGINSATVFLYKRAASEPAGTNACPQQALYYKFADGKLYTKSGGTYTEATDSDRANWLLKIPSSNGNPCYVIQAAALSNEDYDQIATTDWSSVRKMVEDGDAGNGIVSITRTFAISSVGTTASETTEPSHYGSWSVSSPAVTEQYPYLWAKEVVVFTDTTKNTTKYYCIGAKGDNGVDAQDIEWAYIRTKTNIAPVIDNDSTYTDSNGHAYTADDHLPKVVPGTGGSTSDIDSDNSGSGSKPYECTDDPKGVNDIWKYEWEIKRTKGTAVNGRRTWNYYSGAMTLHNNLAESAFIIDTDNDNDQFGTDSESKVLVSQTRSTTVKVYDGATPQTLASLSADLKYEDGTSVSNDVATYTADASTGVVSVTILQNTTTAFSHDEIQAFITASVTGKGSKSTVFTIRKVMSGQPGLSPTIYQLNPTNKTFTFGRDASNNLTPASRSTVVNALKTIGNTTTNATSADNLTFTWGFDESSSVEGSGAVGNTISISNTQANAHYQVWVQLSSGDRETLPIVKDGWNGQYMRENLIDNSEPKNIIDVSDPLMQFENHDWRYLTDKTFDPANIPNDAHFSGQMVITFTGCTFASGASAGIYMNGGNVWPFPARLTNITANGTYTVKTEDFTIGATPNEWDGKVYLQLIRCGNTGTVTIERVKLEIGDKCSAWCLSENDKKGRGITNVNTYFKAFTVTPTQDQYPSGAPGGSGASGWVDDGSNLITSGNADKHLYESTCTTYTDGTYSWTTPLDDGAIADMAATEEQFGLSDSNSTYPSSWSTTQQPVAGKWIWSRTKLIFKSGDPQYLPSVNGQCIGYCGTNGKDSQYIYLRGTARDVDTNITTTLPAEVRVTGGNNLSLNYRGLNLVTLNRQTLAMVENTNYDTYGEAADDPQKRNNGITNLIADLNALDNSVFVCLVSSDAIGWSSDLITALQGFGMSDLPYTETGRYPFLFIGYKGLGKGNGYTRMNNVGSYLNVVELSAYVANGAFTVKDGTDGADGEPGKDAVNVVVSPASMIVEQDINNKDNIAHGATNNLGRFSIQVLKGSTACVITGISATGSHVYVSNSASQGDYIEPDPCTWQPNNQITDMYLKGIAKDGQNNYYSTGQITLSITYTDPDTNTWKTITGIIAKVYVNLIGSWSEEVVGDAKTEVAKSLSYAYDPTGQTVISLENFGQYIKSSTENISALQKRTYGDVFASAPAHMTQSQLDGFKFFADKGSYILNIDHTDQTVDGNGTDLFIYKESGGSAIKTLHIDDGEGVQNETVVFPEEGTYYIHIDDDQESGAVGVYGISLTWDHVTSSQLKQTADAITSTVQRDYATKSQLKQTADAITSEVTKLENGKNLFSGVLTGSGWKLIHNSTPSDIEADGDYKFQLQSGDILESPDITVDDHKDYIISYNAANYATVKICDNGEDTGITGTTRGITSDNRRYWQFNTGDYSGEFQVRFSGVSYIQYPQIETGDEVTAFEASSKEMSSEIKQTADKITLRVSNDEDDIAELQITANGLTSKVNNGKNLFSGVLTGAGWKSGNSSYTNDAEVDEDGWINVHSGDTALKSPVFAVTSGKYTLSLEAGSQSSVSCTMFPSSGGSPIREFSIPAGSGRRSVMLNLSSTSDVYILFSTTKVRYPQIETGESATAFEASSSETASQIKQTASEIDQTITTKLGQTGINIDGSNRTITATADHFEIWDSTKTTKTFSIDNDGNLQSSGNASFKGKITATSGAIGGFDIGPYDLTNTNYGAGITIQNAASAPTQSVQIGRDAQYSMDGGRTNLPCSMRAESKGANIYNTALYLNAQGGSYNYAFHGNGNGVLNGYVQGYKVKVLENITTSTQLYLGNGMVQVVASVNTDDEKYINLPTLGEIRQTLGFNTNDNSINFTCRLVLINQSNIQTTGYNRQNVYVQGGDHSYTQEITIQSAKPRILQAGDGTIVQMGTATVLSFEITYISHRFIANYLKSVYG